MTKGEPKMIKGQRRRHLTFQQQMTDNDKQLTNSFPSGSETKSCESIFQRAREMQYTIRNRNSKILHVAQRSKEAELDAVTKELTQIQIRYIEVI